MNFCKLLIQLSNRLESVWKHCDFSQSPVLIEAGWYVTEFVLQGSVSHTPRVIVEDNHGEEIERELIAAHAGRNRMLVYLPEGKISAISEGIEFTLLARVPWWEGRARILLICFRYLIDFFSPLTVLRMLAMQFKAPFELSTQLLHFYAPAGGATDYYYHVRAWQRYQRFAPQLAWWYRKIKIAVVIENDAQREGLSELMIEPDMVLLADSDQPIPAHIDYVIPLSASEHLCDPAILMIKRAIKVTQKGTDLLPSLIYTDHDYAYDEAAGDDVMAPVFKPNPSAAYLHCFNYIGFSVVYARKLVAELALNDLFDSNTQYSLAIRAFENTQQVLHIAELLFVSNRQQSLTTPKPISENSMWNDIAWYRRGDHNALSAKDECNDYPTVDLIVPTRDGLAVLQPCIDSILSLTDYPNYRIIVVDNDSELPETREFLRKIAEHEQVAVLQYPGEFNYSAINNLAAAYGTSDYIGMINNDIEVIHADWLKQMIVWAKQDSVGIVGAKLLFGNGLVQHAGVTIGMGNAAGHIHRLEEGDSPGYQNRCIATQNMMAVTAACLITPRSLFERLGGLDEECFKVAYNDIDYCLRVEAMAQQVIWTPEARLYHHESVSRGDDMSNQHIGRYFRELESLQKRWKTKGFVDKYYNKHLRIGDEGVYPQIETSGTGPLVYL